MILARPSAAAVFLALFAGGCTSGGTGSNQLRDARIEIERQGYDDQRRELQHEVNTREAAVAGLERELAELDRRQARALAERRTKVTELRAVLANVQAMEQDLAAANQRKAAIEAELAAIAELERAIAARDSAVEALRTELATGELAVETERKELELQLVRIREAAKNLEFALGVVSALVPPKAQPSEAAGDGGAKSGAKK
jgi:chromosome segregation ATPase